MPDAALWDTNRANYELAYTAPLPETTSVTEVLNTLWEKFNLDHPADYQRPSMSVSDIIAIKKDGVVSCHYCDSVGFAEIPDFISQKPTVAELEAQVKAGQTIFLMDLAGAVHRERGQKKSVVAQLKNQPQRAVASADTAMDALAVSIGERACVDLPFMAQLTGKTEDELADELRGVIFKNPITWRDSSAIWQTADEYLSGNVRQKLREAKSAAERDPAYQINVDALTAAQPKDLDASEIEVCLEATWIDKRYIQQFMYRR